jgi:hypothetical protein
MVILPVAVLTYAQFLHVTISSQNRTHFAGVDVHFRCVLFSNRNAKVEIVFIFVFVFCYKDGMDKIKKALSLIEQIIKSNVWFFWSKEYEDANVRNDISNWQFLLCTKQEIEDRWQNISSRLCFNYRFVSPHVYTSKHNTQTSHIFTSGDTSSDTCTHM